MIEGLGREHLPIRELMEDPVLKKYASWRVGSSLFEQQIKDLHLLTQELNELVEMDIEELATCAFTSGYVQESQNAASRDASSGEAAEGTMKGEFPETGSGSTDTRPVTLEIEGMGLAAKLILHDPGNGRPPTDADIRRALAASRIIKGIRFDYIERLAEHPIYDRKFKVAEGRAPIDGEDGRVIFHFQTETDLSPRMNEDGSVDYKSLDYAKNVKKGDVLCEIVPPTSGSSGFSIFGDILPAKPGHPAGISGGTNTVYSEDKRQILAACDGQVRFRNGKISVSRVLMVDRVDLATGNILFVGTVVVKGDVAGGFAIHAGGDIVVEGVVEDALLVSGGNIVLCKGMKGQGGGQLDAGGDIRALFIENTKARAKKNLYADVLLNTTVECGIGVSLSGENGKLLGGQTTAGVSVRAMEIGNASNISTVIRLQSIEAFTAQQAEIAFQITRYQDTVKRLEKILELVDSAGRTGHRFILARVVIIRQRFEQGIRQLKKQLMDDGNQEHMRRVVARERIYPNVSVEIDGIPYRNASMRNGCALVKSKGRIIVDAARYY